VLIRQLAGIKIEPTNPIKLMSVRNASFVARVFADPNKLKRFEEASKL
jgi:hypothetical protein